MQLERLNDDRTRLNIRQTLLRRVIPILVGTGLIATLVAGSVPHQLSAQEDGHGQVCRNETLRGNYGFSVSGVRAAGPGTTEMFVGTGVTTYDGNGRFIQIDSAHGQLTGTVRDRQSSGTYEVNPDCTGTATLLVPGAPFPIEIALVIVDHGQEVKKIVMAPPPNIVTAVERRD